MEVYSSGASVTYCILELCGLLNQSVGITHTSHLERKPPISGQPRLNQVLAS